MDKMIAIKGYHFSDGSYVEYDLTPGSSLTAEELNTLPAALTAEMQKIIEEAIPTSITMMEREEAGILLNCDTSAYPEIVRVVKIADFPCPCGGTHVDNT